jgi:myosin heavy subunit
MAAADSAATFAPRTAVWVPDPTHGYCDATVVSISGQKVTVEFGDSPRFKSTPDAKGKIQTEFELSEVWERTPTERQPVSEMDAMGMLNKAEVLDNVQALFQLSQSDTPGDGANVIYSCVGPVLISMNPFKTLPVYGEKWMKAFHSCKGDQVRLKQLGPHAYRTSDDAYNGLKRQIQRNAEFKNQSVVICGESGAGKTYTNRHMLNYLCEISKGPTCGADPEAITCANELLEAFGNASTTRNDNSSRFGKLTELYFKQGSDLEVCGCEVKHYLIERSRIMGAPPEERNYHIFYELVRGGDHAKFGLTDKAQDWNVIKDGAEYSPAGGIYGSDDSTDFAGLKDRMTKTGFTVEKQNGIFNLIAAVMHMGNVSVTGDQSNSNVDAAQTGMTKACELLGVSAAALSKAVCQVLLKVPGQAAPVEKALGKPKAQAQLDTVAKMIYSRTFDSIVAQITTFLAKEKTDKSIGLLDIFGFEDMRVNGFEQMFINLTNERIQQLFNEIMFDREKKVYEIEGIDSSFLKAPNNIECVNTFLGRGGIVNLLNGQVRLGIEDEKADGAAFVSKMTQTFGPKHEFFKVPIPSDINKLCKAKHIFSSDGRGVGLDYRECFSIIHYAGKITYTVQDFIPKSRDSLGSHVSKLLSESSQPDVAEMFGSKAEEEAASQTVGSKFKDQLLKLAVKLGEGETLFVRAIKSNPGKKQVPVMDRQSVLEQLVRGGVIAALEIRSAGLPDQMLYEDFVAEFSLLEIGDTKGQDAKQRAQRIVFNILGQEAIDLNRVKLGKTKVFMKSGNVSFLRAACRFKEHLYARRVQRLLGSSRVRKIDNLWGMIEEQEAIAKDHNLLKYGSVSTAIDAAKSKVAPIVDKLKKAKEQYGATAWDELTTAMAGDMDQVMELRPLVDLVKDRVQALEKRRKLLHGQFDMRISRGVQEVDGLESRVQTVLNDCEDFADVPELAEELTKCKAACASANSKLLNLREKVLPSLRTEGWESIDLEKADFSDGDPCPQVSTLLAQVEADVKQAETTGYEVLRVKREFMALIEELGAAREAAQQELEVLREPAEICLAAGMSTVPSELKKASDLDFKLESILSKGKDPDAFRAVHAEFLVQVEKAKAAVAEGQEELARRERERAERAEIDAALDGARGQVHDAVTALEKAVIKTDSYAQDSVTMDELDKKIVAVQMAAQNLTIDALREKSEAVKTEAAAKSAEVKSRTEAAQGQHKADFKAKLAQWQNRA